MGISAIEFSAACTIRGTDRTVNKRLPFGSLLFCGYFGSMIRQVRLDTISSRPAHHLIALAACSRTVSEACASIYPGNCFRGWPHFCGLFGSDRRTVKRIDKENNTVSKKSCAKRQMPKTVDFEWIGLGISGSARERAHKVGRESAESRCERFVPARARAGHVPTPVVE